MNEQHINFLKIFRQLWEALLDESTTDIEKEIGGKILLSYFDLKQYWQSQEKKVDNN